MLRVMGNGVRRGVKRVDAERYLLWMLLSFAGSVVLTRVYLQLTGFPQIGGGDLHIAHLLWGGLLLFISALLMLTLANRWVLKLSAILSGVGVGLFIDEVGKFITKTNDYFYPAAAPIIYSFFLLTVLLYFQVRRHNARDARSELYQVFEYLTEVVDEDMDEVERAAIESRLQRVVGRDIYPDQVKLASMLLDFIRSNDLHVVQHPVNRWERWLLQLQKFEAKWIDRRLARGVIVVGLIAFGALAAIDLGPIVRAIFSPDFATQLNSAIVSAGLVKSANGLLWYIARQTLEGIVGVLLLTSAGLLATRREQAGLMLGYVGLLLYLLTVNFLILYFDQFTTILATVAQFGLLMAMMRYRQRYLTASLPTHR